MIQLHWQMKNIGDCDDFLINNSSSYKIGKKLYRCERYMWPAKNT